MSAFGKLDARLAAADPAREIVIDERARQALWLRIEAGEGAASPLLPATRRRRPLRVTLAIALLLAVLTAAALAAGGLIDIGSPAKLPFSVLRSPRAGDGTLLPGSVQQLPIAAPDPAGGPPWGLRELATNRGVGCLQFGRLVEGKLGAIGTDHAFGDDGRFHELPVASDFNGCAPLDAHHRLFANVTADDRPASAWPGIGGLSGGCVPPTAGPYEKGLHLTAAERKAGARPAAICKHADLRNIYYGLLGPQAASITYVLGGEHHTLATVGPEGAYMFVTRASAHQLLNFTGAGTADVVPVDGPVTEIHYRDGSTCHLTAKSWIGGTYACTPSLPEPYGYANVGRAPTAAEVSAPVTARLGTDAHGRRTVFVSFRAPLAITDARRAYTFEWRTPGMQPGIHAFTGINEDVEAGTLLTRAIGGGIAGRVHPGLWSGRVILQQTVTGGGLEGPGSTSLTVGRFAIKVPPE